MRPTYSPSMNLIHYVSKFLFGNNKLIIEYFIDENLNLPVIFNVNFDN